MRPINQMFPEILTRECLRLARKNHDWVTWVPLDGEAYHAKICEHTFLTKMVDRGSSLFGLWALSTWLIDGPKVFQPTTQQCADMENIEVHIELHDYEQPYPAIMVYLPAGYEPFENVLCHRSPHMATFCLHSYDHHDDIVTTIAVDGRPMEASIIKFDEDCASLKPASVKALRVAVNSCLCLVNFGHHRDILLKKQYESDKRLARERSERGERALERVRNAVSLVTFSHDVTLHENHPGSHGSGEPTGREVSPHWRRGHWAMVACGKGRADRKRVLRKPCLVRADRFVGDLASTTTTYHKPGDQHA